MREPCDTEPGLRCEKVREPGFGQVMHEATGDDDGARAVPDCQPGPERITLSETARQALQLGKTPGLSDRDRVEVNTNQLHIRAQSRGGGHRPHHEAQPAAHVHDTQRASTTAAHRLNHRPQQGTDAPAELKLLTQTLQFTMHAQSERIDIRRIQWPSRSRGSGAGR